MNWEAVGAIAELVAAIAVVASLIYLAVQVRHGIATARSTAYQEIYRDLREGFTNADYDPILKLQNKDRLTEEELKGLPKILLLRMRAYENWWVQHRDGVLTDEIFFAYITHLENTLASSVARRWWRGKKVKFILGFEEYVDSVIGKEDD